MVAKKAATTTSYAKYMSVIYAVVGCAPFALMSGSMVKEMPAWKDMVTETCTRRGVCTETLEFTVAKIYLQVIGGMAFMYATTVAIPGKNGLLGGLGFFVATMAKHIVVDGLIPPPPVMAMTAGVIAALLFAPGEWGKRAFIGMCLLNTFTFLTQTLMVLNDSFPAVTADSEAYKVGSFCFEVIALYMLMAGVVAATPNPALGLAYSGQLGLTVLGKHVLINGAGPPLPLILWYLATMAMAWYEVGWQDFKPATERLLRDGPMKLHAIVVGTGFVPYFLLESVGISLPVIGLGAIDSSFAYTGATAMLMGMLAIFCAMTAYNEYTGKMEGKLWAVYHYFLSAVVLLWQFQPSTTPLGAAFFAMPHLFTLWTVYIVCTKEKTA